MQSGKTLWRLSVRVRLGLEEEIGGRLYAVTGLPPVFVQQRTLR